MASVFYSWQSDRPSRENRSLISAALELAIEGLNAEVSDAERPDDQVQLDHDTKGLPGSPEIASAILAKIDVAAAFIADVTPIVVARAEGTLLTAVKYVKAPPQLDWDAIEAFDKLGEAEMIRWASTKFEHWSYEDEHRLFLALEEADESGRYFADFGPTLILREVLVGPESAVTRAQLDAALGSMAVDAWKTRLAFRGYKVVRQHDPLMWH